MLEEQRNMKLAVDLMYINKIPFIINTSRATHFGTIEMIKDKRMVTIMRSLQQVINPYHSRGINKRHILGDRRFECI